MLKYIITLLVFVTVLGCTTAQCILACNTDNNYTLDPNGNVTIETADLLESANGCDSNLLLELLGPGDAVVSSGYNTITVGCQSLQSVTYSIQDTTDGNTCWGEINITDPLNVCQTSLQDNEVPVVFTGTFSGPYASEVLVNGQPLRYIGVDSFALDTTSINSSSNTMSVSTYRSLNGKSTLDLVMIQRFLIGLTSMAGEQAIRADADGSGYIGTNDFLTLQYEVLALQDATPYGVTKLGADASVTDPYDFVDIYDLTFEPTAITDSGLVLDVYQPGDVNASASLTSGDEPVDNRSTYTARYNDQVVAAGQVIEASLVLDQEVLAGCHLSLDPTSVEILDMNIAGEAAGLATVIDHDRASLLYVPKTDQESVVIEVRLRAQSSGMLSELLQLDPTQPQEVITASLAESNIHLEPMQSTSTGDEYSIDAQALQVFPTILKSIVQVTLPEDTHRIEIYDTSGQLVSSRSVSETTMTLYRSDLDQAGVYLLRAIGQQNSSTTRLVAR